ncbi:acid-sensing ion channel 5-like [Euwallacea similis]|uniref:acid-sensing ion channel 5-like n=1 Tax=Euwallacea similis TaxID=1736056 RepID=UPI00344C0EB4
MSSNFFSQFLERFSKNSSIHGVQYIGNNSISKLERLLWLLILTGATFLGYYFVKSSVDHYFANPTVVTIEKDFRNWENPFPAVTACYVERVDLEKAQDYIQMTWGITNTSSDFNHYLDFVKVVSNLTYATLHTLDKFKSNRTLNSTDWLSLIKYVHPTLNGALVTFQTKSKPDWEFAITELGLCFTLNSRFTQLLSPEKKSLKSENLKCHYLNGLCYARYDSNRDMPLFYHVHSPLEVIHATSESPILLGRSQEYEINYKLAETYSLGDIRYLSPQQRKCRFEDEPLSDQIPAYSIGLCFMECRYRLAMERCGCRPFFYNFLEGKECNMEGLLCLSKISQMFYQSAEETGCNCPQPCNLMVYLRQIPKITEWFKGYFDQRITFRWGLMQPMTKYHRKIIFGFQELIVSFGGVLSLYLGVSLISTVETVYLIAEDIYCYWASKKKSTNPK